ncbi:hypothetical protein MKX01_029770 [Papaver californicum]|nr:hypothetical protein MKX01_029770 [Papaver californicum]
MLYGGSKEYRLSMEGITNDAERKWEEFSKQEEKNAKDGADFTADKHCRMELLHQQSTSTVEAASKHQKQIHDTVNEMGGKHVSAVELYISCNTCTEMRLHRWSVGHWRCTDVLRCVSKGCRCCKAYGCGRSY